MQDIVYFLSPPPILPSNSPTFEKIFAESAFFRKLIRYYPEEHHHRPLHAEITHRPLHAEITHRPLHTEIT